MIRLVVVENQRRWPLGLEGARLVPAKEYLTDPGWADEKRAAVFNLCRDLSYDSLGYYVSLLAAARGHRPLPSIATLHDLGSGPAVKALAEEIEDLVQSQLSHLKSDQFELSVYFGHNTAARYERLARALFNAFPAPLLRARFRRNGRWKLTRLAAIGGQEVPDAHRDFVAATAKHFFEAPPRRNRARWHPRYDLAILWREDDPEPPSNARAIRRFVRAARKLDVEARIIGPGDYGRLTEFDALFIRETTAPDDHTYRFSRRATANGLVVIDDPESILRCSNKVYQAERLARAGIPQPRTLVVHEGNAGEVAERIGLPCVLKKPDSSFSLGVVRADEPEQLQRTIEEALKKTPLLIAQEWMPTEYDWRIGVLGGAALFACRYHMVKGHWQIASGAAGTERRYGRVEAVPIDAVPPAVLKAGVAAGALIGKGLYGVDVKEIGGEPRVIEVNDNPNLDAGHEDGVLGEELYLAIMRHFVRLIEARGPVG